MQNLLTIWNGMNLRRRAVVIGATIAMFLSILGLSRMATEPDMALLYAGLQGAAAGDVVTALEQRGIAYEVRGDSILVPLGQRDSLRMLLAGEGLPAQGAAGYELLDGLTGFGTTAQMFDAAYWRAKEGELARTILANPAISAARVHIAQAPLRPFQSGGHPTASVTVTTGAGTLPRDAAAALQHLVAAAVAGMRPQDVSVIDTRGGLIDTGGDLAGARTATDRGAELRHNVERLLAARVGPGKAAVEVAVDLVTESEVLSERRFDPQGRVAISTETEERSSTSTEGEGEVTVASNLPDGDANAGTGGQSQNSETLERTNFEVSETHRELQRAPGSIRRLTVAVLVDGVTTIAADGTPSWQPRPEDEMQALRELVASAVGLDEARGDQLTIRSLQFDVPPGMADLPEPGMFGPIGPLDPLTLIKLGVLAVVSLVLGLFVLRPLLTSARLGTASLPPAQPPIAIGAPASARLDDAALTGVIEDRTALPPMALIGTPDDAGAPEDPPVDPVERLKRLIAERQSESVEILRGWMETAGEGDR